MDNIGRIITDFYCDGHFGREYDMSRAEIIGEGDNYVVIRKESGVVAFASFQEFDWNRNEDGTLSGGVSDVRDWSQEEIKKTIDKWCEGY